MKLKTFVSEIAKASVLGAGLLVAGTGAANAAEGGGTPITLWSIQSMSIGALRVRSGLGIKPSFNVVSKSTAKSVLHATPWTWYLSARWRISGLAKSR